MKNYFLILALALALLASKAFAWDCIEGNCEDGWGKSRSSKGIEYHGHFKDGSWDGYGQFHDRDGDWCDGGNRNFNGVGMGHGVRQCFYMRSGQSFIGRYSRGKKTGDGIFYTPTGNIDRQGWFTGNKLVRSYEVDEQQLMDELVELRRSAPEWLFKTAPIEVRETLANDASIEEGEAQSRIE